MLELQIDNENIELAFKVKFNADKTQFIAFIEDSLQKSEISTDTDEEFSFNKLNPLQNYYKLENNEIAEESLSNPFENVIDTVSFSRKLRENAHR